MYRGVDLTRTRNANLIAPVPTTLSVYSGTGETATPTSTTYTIQRFPAVPADPGLSAYKSLRKYGKVSYYQGLSFEFNRRFANHWQFNTNYTLSKAKDDKPDQTSVVPGADDAKIAENQFDLSGEYGRSDLDVRHRFIFSPVYETGTFKYSKTRSREHC